MQSTMSLSRRVLFVTVAAMLLLPSLSLAAEPEKTDFVCPVFNSNSAVGEKNPNAIPIAGGDYTIVGPHIGVPDNATNGDGAGSPGGDHSSPGDSDYSAIWSG